MANYQLLKADIDEKVYQNGHQEITGENLNYVLNQMVTTLGAEYQFAGVATKDTNPGTQDAKVFYIANGKGTYTNFGGINVTEDEVVILYWDSSWHKVSTGIASDEKLTELGKETATVTGRVYLADENMLGIPSPGYTTTDGIIETQNTSEYSLYPVIPVSPSTILTYRGLVAYSNVNAISFYSNEGNYISGLPYSQLTDSHTTGTVTVPTNAAYALVCSKDHIKAVVTSNQKFYANVIFDIAKKIAANNTAVQEQITNVENSISFVSAAAGIIDLQPTVTNGYFISSLGAVIEHESFCYTEPITLLPRRSIYFRGDGYLTDVAMISQYVNNAYSALVISIDSQPHIYTYKNESNLPIQVVLCGRIETGITAKLDDVKIDRTYYGEMNDYPYEKGVRNLVYNGRATHLFTGVNSQLISSTNTLEKTINQLTIQASTPSYGWIYYYSYNFGNIPAGKYCAFIKIKRVGTSPVSLTVFHGGSTYVSVPLNIIDEDYHVYAIDFVRPENATDLVGVGVSSQTDAVIGDTIYMSVCGITTKRTSHSIGSDIYTLEDKNEMLASENSRYAALVNARSALFMGIPSMGIIGDSLASGVTWNGSELITDYSKAWWRVLERDSGQTYRYFAAGGLTTRLWFTTSVGWPKASLPENKCAAYIIGLQVNDSYSLGLDYLGSESDINLTNPDLNGDTYYGNYAKIIQKITAINPNAKFFLLTNPRVNEATSENAPFNEAVRIIANKFDNAFLVDIQAEYFNVFTNGIIQESMGPQSHYPAYAYAYMGKLIEEAIGRVIEENPNAFKYIQFE